MSKSVSIKEGNTAKSFSGVKKISIKNIGGNSSSLWVPEDEVKLGTKHITENGTYKASEEVDDQGVSKNLYGYSEVTVSGVGVATGTNPETGNEAMVDKDENDNLNDPVDIPSSIGFVLYPQKGIVVPYEDGENITLAGATVRGVLRDNNPWQGDANHPDGFIPLEELSVDPTVAHADSSQYMLFNTHTEHEHLLTWKSTGWTRERDIRKYNDEPAYCALVVRTNREQGTTWNGLCIISKTSNGARVEYREKSSEGEYTDWHKAGTPYYYKDGWYYSFPVNTMGQLTSADRAVYKTTSQPNSDILDAMIADVDAGHIDDTSQTITVKWNRVGDSKELSMQYDVIVEPPDSVEGGGGETNF